ncbi:hypothetical protein CEP52_005016 [Fusarium oligoseptatum]|uniref:Major facilitator superfamily (MFS) profile domain-containing protein n=1 Tax=Fusarium oligoseptatum TaxID=2604345 RepID=A0A428U0D0_9HYPO|nr:hypothetical protein CEP52_005016 [Fusarium oligoseptatum]
MFKIQHPYVWLFCGFAAIGACLYGYDGVYFNGTSTLDVFIRHFGHRNADGEYEISPASLAIMTSMINVGELVGSLAAAPINDLFGRKGAFGSGTLAIVIGVVMQLSTTSSKALMTAGRAVLGFGVGNFSATSPLYMGEIAPESLRSPLLMCWQLTLSVSQIIAAAINRGVVNNQTTFAYRFPIGFQLIFPLVIVLGIAWVPESPRWLLRRGRPDDADRSLRLLHHEDKAYDPMPVMRSIQDDLERERASETEGAWIQLLTDPIERRKVVYSAGALVAQQINAFNFAWGPLGWTIASEMAVGRNRNKIYAVAVAAFWVTVWVFVYTGLCFVTWAYVYFCVGEVTGRSIEEINGFFRDGIPARHWKQQPQRGEVAHEVRGSNGTSIVEVEGDSKTPSA